MHVTRRIRLLFRAIFPSTHSSHFHLHVSSSHLLHLSPCSCFPFNEIKQSKSGGEAALTSKVVVILYQLSLVLVCCQSIIIGDRSPLRMNYHDTRYLFDQELRILERQTTQPEIQNIATEYYDGSREANYQQ